MSISTFISKSVFLPFCLSLFLAIAFLFSAHMRVSVSFVYVLSLSFSLPFLSFSPNTLRQSSTSPKLLVGKEVAIFVSNFLTYRNGIVSLSKGFLSLNLTI